MCVLALYVRTNACPPLLVLSKACTRNILHQAQGTIHGTCDRAPGAVALIVSKACSINLSYSIHHMLEVLSVTALVTGTPHDDTGMVTQHTYLTHRTLYHCRAELHLVRECKGSVTLHIGLSQHIQSQTVGQVIEVGIVGVVGCTHSIHIEALHLHKVGLNLSLGECTTTLLAEAVSVDTMKHHSVAIDEQSTVFTNTHRTETHLQGAYINLLALLLQ